jgi:ABC-type Zn uptake system ZnuABC Zn-binding protein ZnuA
MSRFDDIKNVIESVEDDMSKFYEKGNKAAGTGARKGLQELRKLAQEVRLEIQDIKNRS